MVRDQTINKKLRAQIGNLIQTPVVIKHIPLA